MNRILSFGILSAAIVSLSALGVSAAPFAPPAAPTEAASQAEQVKHRHWRHRYYVGPQAYYGPRYYSGYKRNYRYRGPFVYGGVGVPFVGLSIGGGYHHRHYRRW